MKKYLLLVLLVTLSFSSAFAADPNPYAYNLKKISYDDTSKTLVIGYSLNAPADSIFVYAEDAGGRKYQLCHLGARGAGDHTESLQLLYADDVDILPRNEQLTWGIAAKGKKYNTHQPCGQKISSHTPFSIGIDKNPNSKYFGRIITSQTNNNSSVGLYAYDPRFQGGGVYIDSDVYLGNDQNWYNNTFLTPYRVRIIQDGSGRVLVSSAAVGQPTYLWWVNPDNLNDWRELIQSHIMKEYAPVGLNNPTDDSMGNIDFDLKIDGDKLDILLFGSSLTGTTVELALTEKDKALHSGIYSCNLSDLQGGNYCALTEDDRKGGNPHPLVTNSNYCSLTSAQTAYDKYGGVWFCGYHLTESGFPEHPSLYHLINGNAALAQSYSDGDYLRRKNVGSAAICYNKTFDRFAISQGNLANEARIYNVSQAEGAHPVLSNGSSVDMTSNTTARKLIADMCWDYADNLYLCVRNRDAALQGVWIIAAALNGDTTSTPAPINKGNEFTMTCRDVQHRVTATSSISMSCKIQNADGTDFVDGLYAECSKITLKAVPSAGYKFLGWKKDGNLVSTDLTYSFYVTQETNIMAMFEYAVYNVEWYGLFQYPQDITDYITNPNSSMDGKTNSRLWRLFQVAFNEALKEKYPSGTLRSDQQNISPNGITHSHYQVATFIAGNNANAILLDFIGLTDNTTGLSKRPFKWLAPYIKDALKRQGITSTSTDLSYWKGTLYRFFNRSNKAYTLTNGNVVAYNFGEGDFTEYGKPTYWRIGWADIACGLEPIMSYADDMPVEWDWSYTPTTSIIAVDKSTLTPGNWYKWNNQEANPGKLLAWYHDDKNNPTWPTNPTIVRNVYKSGALFATWVEKLISEEKTIQNNSDAIWLLNYHNGTHDIKILRKMQGGMYNTLCLPFSATKAQQPSVLQNATIVQFTGVNENLYDKSGEPVVELQFTKVDDIVAGVPYLVMPQTDIMSEMTFTNILTGYNGSTPLVMETAQEITKSTNNGSISFIGNIHPTNIPAQSLIVVANNRLAEVTEAGDIQHMRGYFRIDDAQLQTLSEEGRVYLSMKKPATTSIPVAPEAEQQTKPEVRKIMRDGQIYIHRGNEVYTITGHRVK